MTLKLLVLLCLALVGAAAPAPKLHPSQGKCTFNVAITEVYHTSTIEGYAKVDTVKIPDGTEAHPVPKGGLITWYDPTYMKVEGARVNEILSIHSPRANGINPAGIISFGWMYNGKGGKAVYNWDENDSRDDYGCANSGWNDPKPNCSHGGARTKTFNCWFQCIE